MKKTNAILRLTSIILALTVISSLCCISVSAATDAPNQKGAIVTIDGTQKTYDSLEKAWNDATDPNNYRKTVTIKLLQDFEATNGRFGKGHGFTKQGGLYIGGFVTGFTLDLNGFSIDRKSKETDKFDSIITSEYYSETSIINSSDKTSEIRGGRADDFGGAICCSSNTKIRNITFTNNHSYKKGGAIYVRTKGIDGDMPYRGNLYIYDCKFTNNSAQNSGGAIFVDAKSSLKLYDTEITNNTAKKDGGAINCEVHIFNTAKFTVGGKVIIKDNTVNGKVNNLCLDENFFVKPVVSFDKKRTLTDDSYISLYSKTGDLTLRITGYSDNTHMSCFHYEDDAYHLKECGSGSDKYIDIVKGEESRIPASEIPRVRPF